MDKEEKSGKTSADKMSNLSFRGMVWIMNVIDFFLKYVGKRSRQFGIKEGMMVVDYGCGPGRYTVEFAEIVGSDGKVYAVDIHELAMEHVRKKMKKRGIDNVEPVLAEGYNSTLPENVADVVCAIDMFHGVKNSTELLAELKRITKQDGILIIDDGHQSREKTKEKIAVSGFWNIFEESKDHLRCKPK